MKMIIIPPPSHEPTNRTTYLDIFVKNIIAIEPEIDGTREELV